MGSEGYAGIVNLPHVFLVSFPGQGHVNPMLRLGKRLAFKGLLVTLSVPEIIGREIRTANTISQHPTPVGEGFIRFEFFDEEWVKPFDLSGYMDHLALAGRKVLPQVIKKQEELGFPVSCIIINPFIPWAYEVAESLRIPSASLWVQSCASFSAYYHYYNGLVPFPTEKSPEIDVHLPAMPVLKHDEIPSFLHPTTPYVALRDAILSGVFENLSKNICVLMDTFQELETDLIQHMSELCPIRPIGPLFMISRVESNSSSAISIDIIKPDKCLEWLDSKPPGSVVYISFGSVVSLKEEQLREIAHGVLNSGVSFLWVVRPPSKHSSFKSETLPEELLEKLGENGKLVKWCPQEMVLAHPSVACFVTHCGWNSTLESLASGVPVITFPQWGDQVTDAKYLVDEFKVGSRLSRGEAENRIVPREEVEKCLVEATSGAKVAELRENATRWKKLAADAVAEGGSSDRHLQEFVEEIKRLSMHTAGR